MGATCMFDSKMLFTILVHCQIWSGKAMIILRFKILALYILRTCVYHITIMISRSLIRSGLKSKTQLCRHFARNACEARQQGASLEALLHLNIPKSGLLNWGN